MKIIEEQKYLSETDNAYEVRQRVKSGDFCIQGKRYAKEDGTSNTLATVQKDNYLIEPCICASRGRNPENPSDRTAGADVEQRIELGSAETSNTLTTVQKDNLVIEPLNPYTDDTARTLKAQYANNGLSNFTRKDSFAATGVIEKPSDRTAGTETEQRFEINENGTSNTLTSVAKDNYVMEPCVLTPKRNEYGKAIRNEYEKGNVTESRHNMTVLTPKIEPTSNTLTSVQKDNYLIEPKVDVMCRVVPASGKLHQNQEVYNPNGLCGTLKSAHFKDSPKTMFKCRIRKLTPKECIRLMDFDDSDYDKIKAVGMSDSQIYKQCGNSIVVACLYGIFDKLLIHTEITEPQQISLFD